DAVPHDARLGRGVMDVGGDDVGERAALPANEQLEPIDDQVLVLGERHGRPPPVPAAVAPARVEADTEEAEDDEAAASHSEDYQLLDDWLERRESDPVDFAVIRRSPALAPVMLYGPASWKRRWHRRPRRRKRRVT